MTLRVSTINIEAIVSWIFYDFVVKYHMNAHIGSIKLRFKKWSTLSSSPTKSTIRLDFTTKHIT